jgi:hypothetical protein
MELDSGESISLLNFSVTAQAEQRGTLISLTRSAPIALIFFYRLISENQRDQRSQRSKEGRAEQIHFSCEFVSMCGLRGKRR